MENNHFDIEDIVERYAKDYFTRKADCRKERNLAAKDYLGVLIDWRRVHFHHEQPVYTPKPPKPGLGKQMKSCLYHTTFANKTLSKQTYNFKADRTTSSSCEILMEQTFTRGYEASVKLMTPGEIFEANAGFKREMSLTNSSSQVIEEAVTWGVNSDITVDPNKKADAKMIIREEEYAGSFSLKTTINGIVKYSFTNRKDNNSFIRAGEVDITVPMLWARDNNILPQGNLVRLDNDSGSVIIESRGKCKFKYGLEQHIEVDQMALDED